MAPHSSVLAWRIPGTGEPGGLPSMGVSQSRTRLKQLSSSSSGCELSPGLSALQEERVTWQALGPASSQDRGIFVSGQNSPVATTAASVVRIYPLRTYCLPSVLKYPIQLPVFHTEGGKIPWGLKKRGRKSHGIREEIRGLPHSPLQFPEPPRST